MSMHKHSLVIFSLALLFVAAPAAAQETSNTASEPAPVRPAQFFPLKQLEERREQMKEDAVRPGVPPALRNTAESRPALKDARAEQASTTARDAAHIRILENVRIPAAARERIADAFANPERSKEEIARRVANLEKLDVRLGGLVLVKGGLGAEVAGELEARKERFLELRERLANGSTTPEQVREFVAAHRGYALTVPKAATIAAADRILTTATQLEQLSGKLEERLGASDRDVSAAEDMLAAFDEYVAEAKEGAESALQTLRSITEDAEDDEEFAANKAALEEAREHIRTARQALTDARAAAREIVNALKASSGDTE